MANEAKSAGARGNESGGAGDVLGQAQQVLTNVAGQAREQVATRIEGQKHVVSDSLDAIAGALRKTGKQLRADNQPAAPQALDAVAGQVDRLAGYLRDRRLAELVEDAENVGRRNPLVLVGGGFVAGMLATRFLKTSARSRAGAPRGGRRGAARPAVGTAPGRRTGTTGD